MRERLEELPALIAAELKNAAAGEGKKIEAIHPEAMRKLLTHEWRGNLRELSHTVRTMTLFCDGSVDLAGARDLCAGSRAGDVAEAARKKLSRLLPRQTIMRSTHDLSLGKAVERHISFVYKHTQQNQRKTAKLLGISRAKLVRHLKEMVRE